MSRATEKLRFPAFLASQGKCVYCGLDSRLHISVFCGMEVDHVPPRASKHSSDTPDAVVLCCSHCNKMLASHKDALTVEARRKIVQQGLVEKRRVWFDPWMKELEK